jgi:hypothetical protein
MHEFGEKVITEQATFYIHEGIDGLFRGIVVELEAKYGAFVGLIVGIEDYATTFLDI